MRLILLLDKNNPQVVEVLRLPRPRKRVKTIEATSSNKNSPHSVRASDIELKVSFSCFDALSRLSKLGMESLAILTFNYI